MAVTIRSATPEDIAAMADIMVADARARHAKGPTLWALHGDPKAKVAESLAAMEAENPPFRQHWLLAEEGGAIVGLTHTILLPVPPIYAGEFGPPGLVMEDCCVSEAAPLGTRAALLDAAEADLIAAGAQILLASSVTGGDWTGAQVAKGYAPLTLYYASAELQARAVDADIAKATEHDLPAIVAASGENRDVLHGLEPFWKPHAEADTRFASWMARSLTLRDRDMLVAQDAGHLTGYAIAQPATALHFPAAHDVTHTGFIDDYYHEDFADPDLLVEDGLGATALLYAAEAALAGRGNQAVLIVCPAAWSSKREMLEQAGYEVAITWSIRRP